MPVPVEYLKHTFPGIGVHPYPQLIRRSPHGFLAAVASALAERFIDLHVACVGQACDNDRVRGGGQNLTVTCLVFHERLLGVPELAVIPRYKQQVRFAFVFENPQGPEIPDDMAVPGAYRHLLVIHPPVPPQPANEAIAIFWVGIEVQLDGRMFGDLLRSKPGTFKESLVDKDILSVIDPRQADGIGRQIEYAQILFRRLLEILTSLFKFAECGPLFREQGLACLDHDGFAGDRTGRNGERDRLPMTGPRLVFQLDLTLPEVISLQIGEDLLGRLLWLFPEADQWTAHHFIRFISGQP